MAKVLAITEDGRLTYCSAPLELRGKGRCNHVGHANDGESAREFCERIEREQGVARTYGRDEINMDTWETLELNFPKEAEKAKENMVSYTGFIDIMNYRLALMHEDVYDAESRMEFQEKVMQMDRQRRDLHNAAMSSMNTMNRLANRLRLDPFFAGDVTDTNRNNVGEALIQFVTELSK